MTIFSNVNLIDKMQEIVDVVVKHYKTDLMYDIETLSKLNGSSKSDEFHYVWIARECGTYFLRENELFHRDSSAQYTYGHNPQAKYFIIDVSNVDDIEGVTGNIYPIDPNYYKNEIIKDYPVDKVEMEFKSGEKQIYDYNYYDSHKYHIFHNKGECVSINHYPSDSDKQNLDARLLSLRHERSGRSREGDWNHFLKTLERSIKRHEAR